MFQSAISQMNVKWGFIVYVILFDSCRDFISHSIYNPGDQHQHLHLHENLDACSFLMTLGVAQTI
jgi:hypothetical protein